MGEVVKQLVVEMDGVDGGRLKVEGDGGLQVLIKDEPKGLAEAFSHRGTKVDAGELIQAIAGVSSESAAAVLSEDKLAGVLRELRRALRSSCNDESVIQTAQDAVLDALGREAPAEGD